MLDHVGFTGWSFAPTDRAAVQLTPEGLQLLTPASLTFVPATRASASSSGQISWAGLGTDLHPVLGSALQDGATIPVEHFSGYGFVWNLDQGYWGDWEQFRARTWDAYLEQLLVSELQVERQRQLLDSDVTAALDELLMGVIGSWYDWVFSSLMFSAQTSCANGRAAAAAQASLARKVALMGGDPHDIWQRFSDSRRDHQYPLPYTFDGLPFDFVDNLVQTCDREALDTCLQTGDLGLLALYVRDRNHIVDIAGHERQPGDDGSKLMTRCGRYHVDLDETLVDHTEGHLTPQIPDFERSSKWRVQLGVDLSWEQTGASPWTGRLVGEKAPEVTGLGAQYRQFISYSSDRGQSGGHWGRWCGISYALGPWGSWPVELKGLDFSRERAQQELPPPPPAIQALIGKIESSQDQSERLGPTFNYDGPLVTTSFKSAALLFDELTAAYEHYSIVCGRMSGADPQAGDVLHPFVEAQPRMTTWALTRTGLSASPFVLTEGDAHPVIARYTWRTGTSSGTLTLTHTPLPGG